MTHTAFFLWNSVVYVANLSNCRPADVPFPIPLSATTCTAPTVTVLAKKADMTPSANVAPKVLSGGRGEKEFDRKAKTVVTTASIKATRIESKD